jgi:hypothetical protein
MHKDRIVKIDRSRKTVIVYSKLVLCLEAWTNKLLRDSVLHELPHVTSLEQFVYYDLKPGQHEKDFTIILDGKKYSYGRPGGVYAMPHIEDGVPGVEMGLHCNGQIIQNDEFVVAEIQGIGLQNLPNERIKTNEFLTEIDMDIDTYMEKETREFVKTRLP